MATLGSSVLTLADWAKRLDPSGKVSTIVELLSQTNDILMDMMFVQGNLPTGHRTTIRTGLPTVYWRLLNQGVAPSKSTTAQVDEAVGLLEAWSDVDVELANLNGSANDFRLSEASAFIEAMNQEMAQTVFYGNQGLAPEEFTGLSIRYSDTSAANAQNMINGGAANGQTDCSSIWLVVWGENTVHGIFPKGSKAGLDHVNHGRQVSETAPGQSGQTVNGTRMVVYRDQFIWKCGLAVKDWRYAVRAHSIDISGVASVDVIQLMIAMYHRIPNFGAGRAVFYMNPTIHQRLDTLRRDDVISGGGLNFDTVDGKPVASFRGIPVRKVDALTEAESSLN